MSFAAWGFGTLGGVCSLGVRIFGLRCLGVRNFGFTVCWLAGYLGVRIPGFTVPLDLRILQHTWISGSLCGCLLRVVWVLRFFLGSHGTLVAVSAPFMMPLRDSDIPMHVPFTFCNKQPFTPKVSCGPFPALTIALMVSAPGVDACVHTHGASMKLFDGFPVK